MPKYSLRKLIATVTIFSVVAGCLSLAYRAYREFWYGVDDAYAKWAAAEMVIDHMRDHGGEWPDDWASIEPYFATSHGRCGGWSFTQYKERIWIDFDVDVQDLLSRAADDELPDYEVIGAYHSASAFGPGPNQEVHDFLRHTLGLEATTKGAEESLAPSVAPVVR